MTGANDRFTAGGLCDAAFLPNRPPILDLRDFFPPPFFSFSLEALEPLFLKSSALGDLCGGLLGVTVRERIASLLFDVEMVVERGERRFVWWWGVLGEL